VAIQTLPSDLIVISGFANSDVVSFKKVKKKYNNLSNIFEKCQFFPCGKELDKGAEEFCWVTSQVVGQSGCG
jgi:hypothetical protein